MPPFAEAIDRAAQYQQRGSVRQAEEVCREVLQTEPKHVEALQLLARMAHEAGNYEQAADYLRQVLASGPPSAALHSNLGLAYQALGRTEEAEACYRAALEVQPTFAEAHNNLGDVLLAQGQAEQAASCFRKALRFRPDLLPVQVNLGRAFVAKGDRDEAAACFRAVLQRNPNHALAHRHLGDVLQEQGRLDEAAACYRSALRLRPTAAVYNNLGNVLLTQQKIREAVGCFQEALRTAPDFAEAHNNLGNALQTLGQLDESIACYRTALRLKPDYAEAHNNLGGALGRQGKQTEAMDCYERCLRIQPDFADTHWNRSLGWLQQGDFERGWTEYEWRWRLKSVPAPIPKGPSWDGAPLDGKTLLLHTEQGFGDTFQFIRYAPLIKQRCGGRLLLFCPKTLVPLLSCAELKLDGLVVPGAPLPDYDVQAPLLSLPRLMGTTLATIPAEVPYLRARADLVEHWRPQLGAVDDFRIGINWQGNGEYAGDLFRSIPLSHFAALARLPGVRLLSLQKGPGAEQLRQLADPFPLTDLADRIDGPSGAFMDTAAIMSNLDLVVTSDTSIAHLAGALGVPVWVGLAFAADWRWLLEREDSPWYPSLRLFRQPRLGDWTGVFERMAAEVQKLLQRKAPGRGGRPTITVEIAAGELLDKITILEIKSARFRDAVKLRNVREELATLRAACRQKLGPSEKLDALSGELRAVNEELWRIEDDIRRCEARGDFGPCFIELARSVYRHNDRRADLKRQVNELVGSRLVEEKEYAAYQAE